MIATTTSSSINVNAVLAGAFGQSEEFNSMMSMVKWEGFTRVTWKL